MLAREVDPVQVAGAGGRHRAGVAGGQVDALVGADRAARLDHGSGPVVVDRRAPAAGSARRRGRSGRPRGPRRAARPSRPAARSAVADRPRVGGQRHLACRGATVVAAALDLVEAELRARQVAEDPDPLAESARRPSRIRSIVLGVLAGVPWEKLSRKTSAPASISSLEHLRRRATPGRRSRRSWSAGARTSARPSVLTRRRGAGERRAWVGAGMAAVNGFGRPRGRPRLPRASRGAGCRAAARARSRRRARRRPRRAQRNHCPAESSSSSKKSRTGAAARISAKSAPRPVTIASM